MEHRRERAIVFERPSLFHGFAGWDLLNGYSRDIRREREESGELFSVRVSSELLCKSVIRRR